MRTPDGLPEVPKEVAPETALKGGDARWQYVNSEDVRPGDLLEVWWAPHFSSSPDFQPYRGPLDCIYGIALFPNKDGRSDRGMSLEKGNWSNRVFR